MKYLLIALMDEAYGIENNADQRILLTGVGKVNATMAAMKAIQAGATEIINFGTAGLVSNKQATAGELVEVDIILQRDMIAEPLSPRGVTPFETDSTAGTIDLGTGTDITLGTGDSFVQEYDPWFDYANIDIVDMEAYAIAKVCKANNIPFRCYKFVSDFADENANKDWAENVSKGNRLFQETVLNEKV